MRHHIYHRSDIESDSRGVDETALDSPTSQAASATRRDVIRQGVKLAFVAPLIMTITAEQASAAASGNQSCYPAGHACPANESCCSGLVCSNSVCTSGANCQQTNELCFGDSDCCSGNCLHGLCQ